MEKRMLIIGGSGNTGIKIAELLLKHTESRVTLAARNEDKLVGATATLGERLSTDKVSWTRVDASDVDSLNQAFSEADFVVSAASTAQYTREIAEAAIQARIDYLDVQYSNIKVKILKSMIDEIKESGCCFISEGGFHPGLPAALVRYADTQMDELESAITAGVISSDWSNYSVTEATKVELIQELTDYELLFLKNGSWENPGFWSMRDFPSIDFGEPAGKRMCTPIFFEELRDLPGQIPSLKNTGFYIAGFGWFADYIVMPVVFLMMKFFPNVMAKPMGSLFVWAWKTSSKPPYYTMMKLEAAGKKDGQESEIVVTLQHEDAYWFTVIPVLACLFQYLDGTIRKPGLHWMGQLVEPVRLMEDMKNLGIAIN